MRHVLSIMATLLLLLGATACSGNSLPPVIPSPDDTSSDHSDPTAGTGPWQLTMRVSVPDDAADGGMAYNRLVAGSGDTATDGFDNAWDVRAFLSGPLDAYFTHSGDTGYDDTSEQLWQDIRNGVLPATWPILVMAESGRTVTMQWTLPEGDINCVSNMFILEDSDGILGQTDLCVTDSLSFDGDGLLRRFVLSVS